MDMVPALLTAPFTCERLRFTIEVRRLLVLPPYKGGVLHGALGSELRRAECVSGMQICRDCSLGLECLYARIFEPSPPPGFINAGRFAQAPRPFVLTPPLTSRQAFHPGERLEFELVLVGPALDAFPFFVYAFQEIGSRGLGRDRGKYRLIGVDLVRPDGVSRIYDGGSRTLYALPDPISSPIPRTCPNAHSLTLEFATPLRLKEKGDLVTKLTFPLLFERLAQRISLLVSFYGTDSEDHDLSSLLGKAESIQVKDANLHWYDWERYSSRQKETMKFGGLRGTITFEGELECFIPWLYLGELIHVGQSTTFGLGRMSVACMR